MPTLYSETKVKVLAVGTDATVHADVRIGNGQPGGWAAFKGTSSLKKGGPQDTQPFRVGKGSALVGKQLLVNSYTNDIRSETDRVLVTVNVTDGTESVQIRHSEELDPGGMANFTSIVVFVARSA